MGHQLRIFLYSIPIKLYPQSRTDGELELPHLSIHQNFYKVMTLTGQIDLKFGM